MLIAIGGAYYFGTQKSNIFPTSTQTSTPVAIGTPTQFVPTDKPTTDPTANWKTYTNTQYGFSFKYPVGFEVKENAPGYFVITTTAENAFNGSLQEGISIDARLLEPYTSMVNARKSITDSLTITENKEISEWEIYQGIGKDGMLKGVEFRIAISPYKTGAIRLETITNVKFLDIFDQILSTFKFTK